MNQLLDPQMRRMPPIQTAFCCFPMPFGETVRASCFFVNLISHNGDFLMCRFEAEIRIPG